MQTERTTSNGAEEEKKLRNTEQKVGRTLKFSAQKSRLNNKNTF